MSLLFDFVSAILHKGAPEGYGDSGYGQDFIDRYFIVSDLVDIEITDDMRAEQAHYDATSNHIVSGNQGSQYAQNTPNGKQVW